MIRGVIHKNRPLVKIRVGSQFGVRDIVALIDSGFTSELKLSHALAAELGLTITHTEPVALADEKEMMWGASLAFVALEGVRQHINVLISEGDMAIVGIGLLQKFHYNLQLDIQYDMLTLEKYD